MEAPCSRSGFVTPRRKDFNNSARKIKDSAADWHNSMLKWETFNDAGFSVANKIVNIKISTRRESEVEAFEEDESSSSLEKTKLQYNKELEEDCTELLNIFDKMTKLVLKMEKLCATMKGILDLHTHQYGETGREMPLFHTWPTKYFYEVSIQLTEMYKQELQLKHVIVQEIAHTSNSDLMKVELSAWLYQPYIEEKARLLIESMLLETGHRTL
ncbi:cyclin-dependent kinase 2-interacting protein [Rhincodon typus]|uniref:cyclin-dependent kinase 2-interacting protein n=1 Tax=Rhincodon typus TaxID=259920 RepID=UPI0020306B85|nr:cyclin-dependent kinase 2-interacting protein [Rhincodon typus]